MGTSDRKKNKLKIKGNYVVLTVAIDKSLVDLSALWIRSTAAEPLTRWILIENTALSKKVRGINIRARNLLSS